MVSGLELIDYAFKKIDLNFPNISEALDDISLVTEMDTQFAKIRENVYSEELTLNIITDKIKDFKIKITMEAMFRLSDNIKDINRILSIEGSQTIYGIMRNIVKNFSCNSPGYPQITLPLMDFEKAFDESKSPKVSVIKE